MYGPSRYLDSIHRLHVARQGDRRAPHKPLLLLAVMDQIAEGVIVGSALVKASVAADGLARVAALGAELAAGVKRVQ